MGSFKNKTVLVTGGASGIGLKMGRQALVRGAKHLILWDINEDKLITAAAHLQKEGFEVTTQIVDVSSTGDVRQAAELVRMDVGPVDILFNNAGIVVGKPFTEHSIEDIERTLGVNTTGLMLVAKAFIPDMIETGSGHIINIASAAGLTSNPGMTVYAASKWAAVGWSDSLRLEFKKEDIPIRVLTVMPSYINTGMFAGVTTPFMTPLLDPDDITKKILDAVEHDKVILREPLIVKFAPFLKGVLPQKIYDFVAGNLFRVYSSMDTFIGRKTE
ncbi:MAG: SDR family oxidoreductase [Bacteroidota bacterium]